MDSDVTTQVTDQTTVEPDASLTTQAPASASPTPDTVTINRDDYDRLQQTAALADRLAPLADQIERDPFFAQRLMNAQVVPTESVTQPQQDDYRQYDETFFNAPAESTARITKKVIETEFVPQVEKTARALQLQYNRLAIENFRMQKRAADQYATGILPIFEVAISKTSDDELSKMDSARLNNALTVAYDMAAGQYFRNQATKAPKETAPPIAGAPVGTTTGSAATARPSGAEWEHCLNLARAIGKDEDWALKMWRESEQEVKAANA